MEITKSIVVAVSQRLSTNHRLNKLTREMMFRIKKAALKTGIRLNKTRSRRPLVRKGVVELKTKMKTNRKIKKRISPPSSHRK